MNYPNWFKNTENNFLAVLYPLKNREVHFLQIGAYTGDASKWMLDTILTNPAATLTDVDTWQGSNEETHKDMDWNEIEQIHSNVIKGRNVIKFKGTSDEFFSNAKLDYYDFIYIDGDHTSNQTQIDAQNAFKSLKSGGILAFDDYEWNLDPDIEMRPKPGINRFLSDNQGKFILIIKNYQLWIVKL